MSCAAGSPPHRNTVCGLMRVRLSRAALIRLLLGVALGGILALAVAAPAQANVTGMVVNRDGLPVPEVSVRAVGAVAPGTTDESGNYSVEVPPGGAPPHRIA